MATEHIQSISPLAIVDATKGANSRDKTDSDFSAILQSALNDVNEKQKTADNALGEIATGQVKDLHQAAIAIDKAEISMKVMLEVRNKAINAYKELAKTQI
jgi:flagellar hook-basal body complex protein FliE